MKLGDRWVTIGVAAGYGAVASLLLYLHFSLRPQPIPTIQRSVPRSLSVEGLSMTVYDDEGRDFCALRVARCDVRPKKIGFYSVGPAKGLEVSDVEIDSYRWLSNSGGAWDGSGAPCSEPIGFLSQLPKALPWGAVSSIHIRGIVVHFYEEGELATTIKADTITPQGGSQYVFGGGVILTTDGGQRQLRTDRAVWSPKTKCFGVPGDYQLTEGGQPQRGKRSIFDLSLQKQKLVAEVDYDKRTTDTKTSFLVP